MRRYIDADSLLTKIKAYRPYMYLGEDALSYAIKMVELEPTADVRENVRGVWVHDSIKGTVCSVCGSTRRDNRIEYTNFCNVCGADMRGKQNDKN